ncbi:Protein HOL1 [Fusarium oxysporum f. sp. albedinis]|nr:Protein HOL1 [Fusarium oxysporum f. sp. albedinis]
MFMWLPLLTGVKPSTSRWKASKPFRYQRSLLEKPSSLFAGPRHLRRTFLRRSWAICAKITAEKVSLPAGKHTLDPRLLRLL